MADPTRFLPAADPIALPAPVWLFKSLSDLTLTLHFAFLSLLLGGLALSIVWNLWGHRKGSAAARAASDLVAQKLPIVTTYVINLGVPPLLFAQVLYGQALYTSSVLMGAWWISVVFAVILAYAVLYRISKLAASGREWWGWGLVSLPVLGAVGRLYSANMALMLRPDTWASIYAANPHGTSFPHDPTAFSRWHLVMLSALALGALGTALWSIGASVPAQTKSYLRRWSGLAALLFSPGLLVAGHLAWSAQPEFVRAALGGSALYRGLAAGWLVAAVVSGLAGLALFFAHRSRSWILPVAGALPAVAALATFVILRDQVRDITLSARGFDVWRSAVNTNWTVVGLFVVALVVGLGVLGWIGSIVARAVPLEDSHA